MRRLAARFPCRCARRPSRRWIALAVLLATVAASSPVEAQGIQGLAPRTVRFELAAAASTPVIEDGSGIAVRRGIGAFAAAEGYWTIAERTMVAGALRGSVAPLTVRGLGRHWSGGWTQDLGVGLRVERDVSATISAGAGLAVAVLHGPEDVLPFRTGSGGVLFGWGPELVVAARLARQPRLDAVLGADAAHISARNQAPDFAHGWVGRIRLGIRYDP